MSLKAQSRTRRDVSLFARFINYLQLMYYQYEVTFSAYVLTPGEKTLLNSIALSYLESPFGRNYCASAAVDDQSGGQTCLAI